MGTRAVTSDYIVTTQYGVGLDADQDRDYGHHIATSLYAPSNVYVARRDHGILWTVRDAQTLLVRSTTEPVQTPTWVQNIERVDTPQHAAGDTIDVRVDLVPLRSPIHRTSPDVHAQLKAGANGEPRPPGEGLAFRVNKVPVPIADLPTWARRKLERHGLAVDDVRIESHRQVRVKRGAIRYPLARIHATGTVTDADSWNAAVAAGNGLGKGKAWGAGTIVCSDIAAGQEVFAPRTRG